MSPRNRGLGRGLNALFDDSEVSLAVDEQENTPASTVDGQSVSRQTIGIDQLEPSRFQPRTVFDNDTIDELAESIRSHGLLQPVLVRKSPDDPSQYEIIAGERRWRAAQRAQLHDVPVIIREMTDIEALEIALIENLQREDLNPVDEAMGYKRLLDEHDYTQEQLAESLGKSRSYIANMIRLLGLSDVVLGHLERGDLSIGHARALITADDAETLARRVISENLSVRDTEKMTSLASGRAGGATASSSKKTGKSVDTLALEKDISANLGMKVSIAARKNGAGRISIDYKSLDQLDDILKRLS